MDIIGNGIVIDFLKTVVNEFSKKLLGKLFTSKEDKINISKAITSIKKAVIETKSYIEKDGYKQNTDLSALWLEAMNACVQADITGELPEYLYHKADFWGSPQDWLNNPGSLELVPKLRMLNDECDSLLVKLKS